MHHTNSAFRGAFFMGSMMLKLSHSELLRLVHYDPETGIITRKVRTSNRVKVGDECGYLGKNGYKIARIGGVYACVHQFAWFYVYGVWPDHDIDHHDRDKINNRIANLRAATVSQNMGNILAHKDSRTGIKGIHKKRDKWTAQIMCGGVRKNLGSYPTKEQAGAAYEAAAREMFGEFARVA